MKSIRNYVRQVSFCILVIFCSCSQNPKTNTTELGRSFEITSDALSWYAELNQEWPASICGPVEGRIFTSLHAPSGLTILATRPLVPVTSMYTSKISVKREEHTMFTPVDWLDLPMKALRLDGLTIEDPQYPLQQYLIYEGLDNPKLNDIFLNNFSSKTRGIEIQFFGFVGDLMPGRGLEKTLEDSEGGLQKVFGSTLPLLQSFDYLIGNLEGTVSQRSLASKKRYTFKYPSHIPERLKTAGFDFLMLTNNHSWDFGLEGFNDTLQALTAQGFTHAGAGKNLEAALIPVLIPSSKQTYSIISLAAYPVEQSGFSGYKEARASKDKAGVAWLEKETLDALSRWHSEHSPESLKMALVHGGQEYRHEVDEETKKLYEDLADSGYKVIVGSHPHVLQGMSLYNKGIIVYSLGNFLFPGMGDMFRANETVILSIGFKAKQIVYLEAYGAVLNDTGVNLASNDKIVKRWYQQGLNL